jgi:hypothetical protein
MGDSSQHHVTEPSFPQRIGRCVYCGRSDTGLKREHIVPYGLGGTWVLERASCDVHAQLTSRIETEVLKHAWGPGRAVMAIRTRHKKDRPAVLPETIIPRTQIADHPGSMVFLKFSKPGQIPSRPCIPNTPIVGFARAERSSRMHGLARAFSANAVRLRYPDPLMFAQFLGKIAHCFGVACRGVDEALRSPLLRALLSDSGEIYRYVGNDPSLRSHTELGCDHCVTLSSVDNQSVVFIRLMAHFPSPEYVVRLDSPGAA